MLALPAGAYLSVTFQSVLVSSRELTPFRAIRMAGSRNVWMPKEEFEGTLKVVQAKAMARPKLSDDVWGASDGCSVRITGVETWTCDPQVLLSAPFSKFSGRKQPRGMLSPKHPSWL
jgi:hypothetical protein